MHLNRFIPCLLLKDGGLVKTEKFKNPVYVGDPMNAIKIFNEKYVDELIFLDTDASKKKRSPNFELLKNLATECFMPFAYGGGITTLGQIEMLIQMGIEKIIINHKALLEPNFLHEAVKHFGSSTIIGAIDVKKSFFGKQLVYDHTAKKNLKITPLNLSLKYVDMGVGEIFLNNVDLDGTMLGFDLDLIKNVSNNLPVSLIASGGASSVGNLNEAIANGASAASAGALFVFQGPHKAVLISYL